MRRLLKPLAIATLACSALVGAAADTTTTTAAAADADSSSSSPPSFLSSLSGGTFHSLRIRRTFAHDASHFTQGLAIENVPADQTEGIIDFYESTGVWGGTYVHHYTLPIDYPSAELKLRASVKMPGHVFGEGLAVLAKTILQLTWQNGHWYQYAKDVFAPATSSLEVVTPTVAKPSQYRTLAYPTSSSSPAGEESVPGWKEGWGMAYDRARREIYVSDGSHHVFVLGESDLTRVRRRLNVHYLDVHGREQTVDNLNELEFIPKPTPAASAASDESAHGSGSNPSHSGSGELFANYYESYCLLRIDPSTGRVLGVIKADQREFYRPTAATAAAADGRVTRRRSHPSVEAMNGIAFHEASQRLFVTGKLWNAVYEVQVEEHADAPPPSTSGSDSTDGGGWHLDLAAHCPRLRMGPSDMTYWQSVLADQAKRGAQVEAANGQGQDREQAGVRFRQQEKHERLPDEWSAVPPQSAQHKELAHDAQKKLRQQAAADQLATQQARQQRLDALVDREGDLSADARAALEASEEVATVLGHDDRHFDLAAYVQLEMRTMGREAEREHRDDAEAYPEMLEGADAMISGDMEW